jgi:hypothetical protein
MDFPFDGSAWICYPLLRAFRTGSRGPVQQYYACLTKGERISFQPRRIELDFKQSSLGLFLVYQFVERVALDRNHARGCILTGIPQRLNR